MWCVLELLLLGTSSICGRICIHKRRSSASECMVNAIIEISGICWVKLYAELVCLRSHKAACPKGMALIFSVKYRPNIRAFLLSYRTSSYRFQQPIFLFWKIPWSISSSNQLLWLRFLYVLLSLSRGCMTSSTFILPYLSPFINIFTSHSTIRDLCNWNNFIA